MSVLTKLFSQTALYGFSSIIGRSVNFLLVPFYTSLMLPKSYGIITELYAYVAFLNVLYTYGMETAYFRYANMDLSKEPIVYANIQSSILLSSIIFTGVLILFSSSIVKFIGYNGYPQYIYLLALVIFTDAASAIPFAKLRLENNARWFVVVKLANIILNVWFNVFFLVLCDQMYNGKYGNFLQFAVELFYHPSKQVEYVFLSNLLANLVYIALLWKPLVVQFKFSFSFPKLKPYLIYGYPIMIMGFAGMINEMLSRSMLKYILPDNFYNNLNKLEALGIFGACYKLSMFMSLAIQAFRYAADPFFFSKIADKNAPDLFAKTMKWFVIFCSAIYLFVSLFVDLFGLLLRKPVYRLGLDIVPILLLANLFLGIYYNLSVWYKLTDRTYYGTYISVFGAIVTIISNLLLIPAWGYMGAAVATLICYFLMSALSYNIGQKYYPIPYSLKSAFFYIGLSTLLILIKHTVNFDGFLNYVLGAILIFLYAGSVWFFEQNDIKSLTMRR